LMKVKVKTKYPMIYNHPIYDLNQIRYWIDIILHI
jgi:hypothetical protein